MVGMMTIQQAMDLVKLTGTSKILISEDCFSRIINSDEWRLSGGSTKAFQIKSQPAYRHKIHLYEATFRACPSVTFLILDNSEALKESERADH